MWRSFWRSIDRFSLQHFKYVINELRAIKVVDSRNRELVIDLLQSIVEIVTYGDRQDPMIFEYELPPYDRVFVFEVSVLAISVDIVVATVKRNCRCFMEYQVLAEFVRVLKISRNSRIEAPLLQYLSIMIQNMDSEQAVYYCLSNDYVNSIIANQYDFNVGDLAPYYVSFLRAVSSKINRDTLCLLVRFRGDARPFPFLDACGVIRVSLSLHVLAIVLAWVPLDAVVSFPLYTEALKFAHYEEKMIQTAVRALTLNTYNVSDDMVFQFIATPPASKYFLDLVCRLRQQCLHLDTLLHAKEQTGTHGRRNELILETDKIVDDLYYLKDILGVGECHLSRLITQNLFSLLVFPILLPLLQLRQLDGSNVSAVTSLYIISRLLQVVGGKTTINTVAGLILYPYMTSSVGEATEGTTVDMNASYFFDLLKGVVEGVCSGLESEGSENVESIDLFGHLEESISANSQFISSSWLDVCTERGGILAHIFADDHYLLLASLFLLLIIAESKDLDFHLASMIGLSKSQDMKLQTHDMSASQVVDESIFVKFMPQILNALLKILASQPPLSILIQWHTGWFFRKLLISQGKILNELNFKLFNTSYEQSRERLWKELDGCWFDYIPDTLRNEWPSCKTALEESSQSKDPLFALELAVCQQKTDGDTATLSAWQRMVEAVKIELSDPGSVTMWRSFWRSIDRFSLQHFKYVINELRAIKVVDSRNRELVIDLLQSIVEIVTYGDRQDPMIFEYELPPYDRVFVFEVSVLAISVDIVVATVKRNCRCFMEYQVLAEFVRVLKISRNSRIEAPLLQYLSIMIQNMDSEQAVYYCLSNDYVNSIIANQYDFNVGDLAPYYVSFLRAVSSKINRDTLCLLVKVQGDAVVSFPLYTEALKFAHYEEKMIQTAVRALTLNTYNVSDDMVFQFIATPPASKYFLDLVCRLRQQCLHLDTLLHAKEQTGTHGRRNELILETDKIVDDLYYLKDILGVGECHLSRLITQNLFSLLVFPILLPLLQLRQLDGSNVSAVTSLYIISRLLQVVGGKTTINTVAGLILYPYMTSSVGEATEGTTVDMNASYFFDLLKGVVEGVCSGLESEGSENVESIDLFGHLEESISANSQFISSSWLDVCTERGGILAHIFADDHYLLLASLFLLLIIAESKDLDFHLASMIGLSKSQDMKLQTHDMSASQVVDESIFVKFMPQILNALLKILASQPPLSILIQWHTGWFFRKLLISQGKILNELNFKLFNVFVRAMAFGKLYESSFQRIKRRTIWSFLDEVVVELLQGGQAGS
ncbi:Protein CLEC16A [Morella rubra]|uniref:Protein CLEC16A n=1 Tax=Morella rubra TaxID=262757 RepID=A0A6A1US95_9ROSI|nr:Protein CLEC16A [Morella rubra]